MRELLAANPECLQGNQVYFYDGLLLRFVEIISNSQRSYWVFEPLQGQGVKALIKLRIEEMRYSCFAVPGYTCLAFNEPTKYIQLSFKDYLKQNNEETKQQQTNKADQENKCYPQHLVVNERSQQGIEEITRGTIQSPQTSQAELLPSDRKLLPKETVGHSALRCQHFHPEILFLQWLHSNQRTHQADCGGTESKMNTQNIDKLEQIERLLAKQIRVITDLTSKQQLSKARRQIMSVIDNQLIEGVEQL